MHDFECPYCGYGMEGFSHFDISNRNDIKSECQNEACGRTFLLNRDFDVTYTATPLDADASPASGGGSDG